MYTKIIRTCRDTSWVWFCFPPVLRVCRKKKKKRNKLLLPGSVLVFSKVECPKASFQEKDMRQTISLQFVHESENGSLLYESQLSES